MFCNRCGCKLTDEAVFCANCGTVVNGESGELVVKKNFGKKKRIILTIVLACVICVIVTASIFVFTDNSNGFSTPEEAATEYVEAIYDGEPSKMVECMPDFFVETILQSRNINNKEELAETLKEGIAELVNDGNVCSILEVDKKAISKEDKSYFYYSDILEFASKHGEICEVNLYTEIKNNGQTTNKVFNVLCVKCDDGWYVLTFDNEKRN